LQINVAHGPWSRGGGRRRGSSAARGFPGPAHGISQFENLACGFRPQPLQLFGPHLDFIRAGVGHFLLDHRADGVCRRITTSFQRRGGHRSGQSPRFRHGRSWLRRSLARSGLLRFMNVRQRTSIPMSREWFWTHRPGGRITQTGHPHGHGPVGPQKGRDPAPNHSGNNGNPGTIHANERPFFFRLRLSWSRRGPSLGQYGSRTYLNRRAGARWICRLSSCRRIE